MAHRSTSDNAYACNIVAHVSRSLRFSLRGLLIIVICFCFFFTVLSSMFHEARRQRKAIAELEKLVHVHFNDERTLPVILDTSCFDRVSFVWRRDARFDDLSLLTEFTNLERIELQGTRVSDVTPLGKLSKLTYVDLSYTRVDDVLPLTALDRLTFLSLLGTRVTDVSALAELAHLEYLNVSETRITDEQVKRLRQALPKCDVDY